MKTYLVQQVAASCHAIQLLFCQIQLMREVIDSTLKVSAESLDDLYHPRIVSFDHPPTKFQKIITFRQLHLYSDENEYRS